MKLKKRLKKAINKIGLIQYPNTDYITKNLMYSFIIMLYMKYIQTPPKNENPKINPKESFLLKINNNPNKSANKIGPDKSGFFNKLFYLCLNKRVFLNHYLISPTSIPSSSKIGTSS